MAGISTIAFLCLSVNLVLPISGEPIIESRVSSGKRPDAPFTTGFELEHESGEVEWEEPDMHQSGKRGAASDDEILSSSNGWGFESPPREKLHRLEEAPKTTTKPMQTTTPYYEEVDPDHNGFLKDIGAINVGFGVGVGVPGNDPVKVAARVGVGLGESGLAGKLPIGQDIFPRQGEWQSLNDYDGNKANIVPDRAQKYWQAVREGRIRIPHYRPATSLVGVGGNVGVGTAG